MFAKSKRGQANAAQLAQEAACTDEGGCCLHRCSVLLHVPCQQLSPLRYTLVQLAPCPCMDYPLRLHP